MKNLFMGLVSLVLAATSVSAFARNEVTAGDAPYCQEKAREVVRKIVLATYFNAYKVSTAVTSFKPEGDGAEYYENFTVKVSIVDEKGKTEKLDEVFQLRFYTEADWCDLETYSKTQP